MFDRTHEYDGYDGEDVMDLDQEEVLNFLDINYEQLPGGNYHDEARNFHEEFEERLDAILAEDLREDELARLEDVDALIEEIG